MMKNVIAYFSKTTKPKVIVFDDESITIRFVNPWPLVCLNDRRANVLKKQVP